MKKTIFNLFACMAIVSMAMVSCRQEDQYISKEDNANLQVLNKYKSSQSLLKSKDSDSSVRKDTIKKTKIMEGDPFPPPKK